MTLLSGKKFNYKFGDKKFYKLINKEKVHNDFKFKVGINVDFLEFNPKGKCEKGGLYFVEHDNIGKWIKYNKNVMYYYSRVTIPEDAKVYIE